MSTTETGLAIVGQSSTALTTGGLGRTGTSKLLEVTPANLSIVQSNSTLENGKKGHLIIDGDESLQYKEMTVTLLLEPEEQRAYYVGEAGGLNRTPENLHCFSRDMVHPDDRAKFPQAHTCASCPKASWEQFRLKRDKGIPTTKDDIPPCDAFYLVTLIDTVFKMPLRLYVRSQSKEPFEKGMKQIARKLAMIGATTGRNPNIFDVSFKLSTKQVTKGKYTFYVLQISDVEGTTEEQREAFGTVFGQFNAAQERRQTSQAEAQAQSEAYAQIDGANTTIDQAVTGAPLEGVYEEEIPL